VVFDVAQARDPSISCSSIASGVYLLDVSASAAHCADIPGNGGVACLSEGEVSSIADPLYLLSVFNSDQVDQSQISTESWESGLSVAQNWPELPSCGPKSASFGKTEEEETGGCCGSLRNVGPPSSGDLLKILSFQAALWILAWASIGFVGRFTRRRKWIRP
jgi:hypothetical protein